MTLPAGICPHDGAFAPGEAALIAGIWRRACTEWRLHVAAINVNAQQFYERYGLVRGLVDRQPDTGRERMTYHRPAPPTYPGPP